MAKKDRQIERTIEITGLLHAFGEATKEVVFYTPKAKLLREIEANDQAGEQSLAIASSLTAIPMEQLDELSLTDGMIVIGVAADIVKKSSDQAQAVLASLGIDAEDDEDEEAQELEGGSPAQPESVSS